MSRYELWYRIIIAGKVYLGEGSLDNALFSAARRHDFDEDHGYVFYEKIEKPKAISKAAFKRMIEKNEQ